MRRGRLGRALLLVLSGALVCQLAGCVTAVFVIQLADFSIRALLAVLFGTPLE